MPDLDLIKQGEQGVRDRRGRLARAGRAISPAGRAAAATMSTGAARLLLAGAGEALTRRRIGARQRPESERPLGVVGAFEGASPNAAAGGTGRAGPWPAGASGAAAVGEPVRSGLVVMRAV